MISGTLPTTWHIFSWSHIQGGAAALPCRHITALGPGSSGHGPHDAVKMQKILDALEDLDDVQDVYTTAVIEE